MCEIVRMQPLLVQAHLFFLCLSLLSGGSSSGLSHGSSTDDTAREFQDLRHAWPKRRLSWTEIYVPVRRCHAILQNKTGEFSIPVIRNRHLKNIWCNWTIWAGPRNHIIIYIQGFRGNEDCEENPDKIIFQGVASIVESTIAYACWNKRVHVYATQALAVNVALLSKNYVQNHRYKRFRGKYYIFKNPRARVSHKEDPTLQVPFQKPSNKLPYSSTRLKFELSVVMSQGGIDMTSPKLMPSKVVHPESAYTWEREKVEFSETSLPYSERPSGKSHADGIMVTKTLGVGEMSPGDELFSKALGKTAAFDTSLLEITEGKSILSSGSTMDGSAIDIEIFYENTPYFVGPEQSVMMEDWPININSERADGQTNDLIPTSEDVPINIKPTPISHSVFIILSDSEFLEKTEHSKNEKIQISPSQIWSSLLGSEQQPFLQTKLLTHEVVTLSTDSRGNHMSGISLDSETQLPLEGSLHLIPVVPTVHTTVDFSPKSSKGDDLLDDPHSEVVISLETLQTLGSGGMIWLSSQEIFNEAGLTLILASHDEIGLVTELPSTTSIRSTLVRAEVDPEVLLQTVRPLPGPTETESLASSVTSEEVSSRHQVSLTETDLKFILGQERSLPFTTYQESLFDAELIPSPQMAMFEIVPEWVLQDIPGLVPSTYLNEQGTTEQSLGIPLTLTPAAMAPPWELDEIQNEVTVQPSKKDDMVNENNPQEFSSSFGKDQKLTKFNFTSLLSNGPTMSLGKWNQTGDLSAVSSSLTFWSEDTKLLEAKKLQDSSEVLTSTNMVACIPVRRCHVTLKDTFGIFSLPENLNRSWPNICCNWTIWAGTKKHIVVYIKGFEGPENCDQNQDKIIFQGVSSSVERKTFYACKRQGTLIFATQALAVHTMFFSVRSSRHIPSFEGQYFVFTDPERQVPPKPAIGSSLETSQRLRERTLSSMDSHPELITKPQPGSFPNLNTIHMGLKQKSQVVTKILMPKNKELMEGEGKAIEWKHLHSLLPLIPTKRPLIKNQNSAPKLLGRPTETIKNSAERDSVETLGMTSIPVTSCGYKPENKVSQDDLPVDSVNIHPHWPSKTFPLTELLLKPVDIPARLLPSASIQERRTLWVATKTEELVWQVISKASNFYSPLTAQNVRKPQDAEHNHGHLYQSFSHVMLGKGNNFLEIRPEIDKLVTAPSNIPKEELFSNFLFSDKQVAPEFSATGNKRVREISPIRDEVNRGVSLDPAKSSNLENIRHLNEEFLYLGNSREMTTSNGFVWDSISPGSLIELSPSLKTPCTAQSFLREVTDSIHPDTGAGHSSATIPNFKAKAMVPLISGQVWKNMTAVGVLVLTPGYSDASTTSSSFGNKSVLEFQHYPGDILYEVIVEMECQVEAPCNASEVEKVLVDSLKQEIGGNLDHFSPEADAFKLTRMKSTSRKDTSNVIFIFWLHLRSRGRKMSDTLMSQLGASESGALHSQLTALIRDTIEDLKLHLKSISIHDVNECKIGLEQCGEGAECFNGVGTYMCHCKEDYEDRSPMQTGTLCIRVPRSGAGFSFTYLDLLITVAVFAIILFMLIIGFVWLASRTTQKKRDFCLQETTSLEGLSLSPLTQTKPCLNLRKFNKYSLYNPYQPKPRVRVIDGSLEQIPYLSKDSHVCMEQSESLK